MTTDSRLAGAHGYSVSWSPDDHEFVATCTDFPSLSWLSSSAADAVAGLEGLVAEVVAELTAADERMAPPRR